LSVKLTNLDYLRTVDGKIIYFLLGFCPLVAIYFRHIEYALYVISALMIILYGLHYISVKESLERGEEKIAGLKCIIFSLFLMF
jgi:hypothetical protein